MKKTLVLMAILLMVALLGADIRIIKSKNGKELNLKQLAKELKKYDVIFVGEEHGNATIHSFQRQLLPLIYQPKKPLILSFEMWERDTQEVLDDYLAGRISEESFMENSRVWENYESDYRPLLHFALERRLPAIAANIPRELAGRVARSGLDFIAELSPQQAAFVAKKIHTPDDQYRRQFMRTMQDMVGHDFDADSLERYYQAQCIKDDTMAESIVIALDYYKKRPLIHFNGAFHSRSFLGTADRLQEALPRLKIAVITPVFSEDWQKLKPAAELLAQGSYLLLMDDTKKESLP